MAVVSLHAMMVAVPPSPQHSPIFAADSIRRADWRLPALGEDVMVAGVASGVAAELGVKPNWIRVAFVFLFSLAGLGAFVYVGLWALLGWAQVADIGTPRSEPVAERGQSDQHRLLAVAMITVGFAIGGSMILPFGGGIGFGSGAVLMGLGLAWRTSSTDEVEMPARRRVRQLASGLVAVVGGLALVLVQLNAVPFFLGAAVVAFVGTVIVAGPWLYQVLADFDAERQARIRSDERAEVAAHIHDSVLQTLALIQKADDPQTAVNLARRQERELRNWLDPNRASRFGGSIRGHLDQMVTDIEELHGVPIEVVAVGDAIVDEQIAPLLRAAREACVNAAKHSGTPRIDIFLEVSPDRIELFVRDKGKGFEQRTVAADRHGVSQSIIGRMERNGGRAEIHSQIGEGTEVELILERDPKDQT